MIRAAEPLSKVCSGCGRDLPIADFRFRKRGAPGRQGCCRECYNDRMRGYRFVRRAKTIKGFSAAVLREKGLQGISRLCAGMFARFGGADGFCRVWHAHLQAAPVGSRTAGNALSALLKLTEAVDAQRQPADYSGLTDSELDEEIQRLLGNREDSS